MAEYLEAYKTEDLKNGQKVGISVGGQKVLLARVEDKIYAVSDVCPHMKGRLSMGSLTGTVITCPRHASQFDLKDGHVVRWTNWSGLMLAAGKIFRAPRPVKTYPVKIVEDKILVEI